MEINSLVSLSARLDHAQAAEAEAVSAIGDGDIEQATRALDAIAMQVLCLPDQPVAALIKARASRAIHGGALDLGSTLDCRLAASAVNSLVAGSEVQSGFNAFEFDGHDVRIEDRHGQPWFVLSDVCRALDIANSRHAASRLDADEKGVVIEDTPGGKQRFTVINESGLYSLILTSRKPSAKRFKKWVTSEVLPAIRISGGYGMDGYRPGPREMTGIEVGAWANMVREVRMSQGKLAASQLLAAIGMTGEWCDTQNTVEHVCAESGTEGITRTQMRKSLRSMPVAHVDQVISRMKKDGIIREVTTNYGRGRPVTRIYLDK